MKKIFVILFVLSVGLVKAQPITDTGALRNYINTNIVTNGTKAITAPILNKILNGYLNAWPNFNLFVPSTRTITINGVTHNLASNASFTVAGGGGGLTFPNISHRYLTGFGGYGNLISDSLTEGSANLFFTNTRARGAFSFPWGLTWNPSTGALAVDSSLNASFARLYKVADSLQGINTSAFAPKTRTLTINGVAYDLSANRSWTITGGGPLSTVLGLGNDAGAQSILNALDVKGAGNIGSYHASNGSSAYAMQDGSKGIFTATSQTSLGLTGKLMPDRLFFQNTLGQADIIWNSPFAQVIHFPNSESGDLTLATREWTTARGYLTGPVPNTTLATMPTLTIKGNNTGSTSSPVDLSVSQVKTMLNYSTTDVPEGTNNYFTDARVRASPLTGLSITNSAITSSDQFIGAMGKLQGQINGLGTTTSSLNDSIAAHRAELNQTIDISPNGGSGVRTFVPTGTYTAIARKINSSSANSYIAIDSTSNEAQVRYAGPIYSFSTGLSTSTAGGITTVTASGGSGSQTLQQTVDLGNTSTADIEITDSTKGYIGRSPNGNRYRLVFNNDGSISSVLVAGGGGGGGGNYLTATNAVNYQTGGLTATGTSWTGSTGLDNTKTFNLGTSGLYLATYNTGGNNNSLALDPSSDGFSVSFASHEYFCFPDNTNGKLITGEATYSTYGYYSSPVMVDGDTYGFEVLSDGTVQTVVVHAGTKTICKIYPVILTSTIRYLHAAEGSSSTPIVTPKTSR